MTTRFIETDQDRRVLLHLGIKRQTSRPIPGSKASGWRKPFNGPPERRY